MPQLVTCEEIKKQATAVHASCRPIMNTSKPKPKTAEPAQDEAAKPASGSAQNGTAATAEAEGNDGATPETVSVCSCFVWVLGSGICLVFFAISPFFNSDCLLFFFFV